MDGLQPYQIRPHHVWNVTSVTPCVRNHRYVKIGRIAGYGKNTGYLYITGIWQQMNKHPTMIYVRELRIVGVREDVENFMEYQGKSLDNYTYYSRENYDKEMKELLLAEIESCQKSRCTITGDCDSTATTSSVTTPGKKNLSDKIKELATGKVIDVSNIDDNGFGIKTILAAPNPVKKMRIDPLPIASDNPQTYDKALQRLVNEKYLTQEEMQSYSTRFLHVFEARKIGN